MLNKLPKTLFKTINNRPSKRISSSMRSILLVGLFTSPLIASVNAYDGSDVFSIDKMADAQVFAEFSDKMPVVVNYFTSATEAEVLAFYQEAYGKLVSQERKRGRLTSYFSVDDMAVRVVISQQNNKRQVDILVEKIATL